MRLSDRFVAMTWQRGIVAVVIAALVWVFVPASGAQAAPGTSVELKVLLLTNGGTNTSAIATLMDREGVPHTTVDLTSGGRPTIDADFLADTATGRGHFQAIVLPDAVGTGLSGAEFTAVKAYEQQYGVRQVNAYGYPGATTGQAAPSYSGTLDAAPLSVTTEGLAGPFAYLTGTLAVDNFDGSVAEVSGNIATGAASLPTGATFTPLINATAGGHTGAIVSVYNYEFREQLNISAAYNSDQQWFNEIGHGIVTWMTRGIHLGYHRNYFAVHVDDIFLADGRWDPTAHCTPGDSPTCTASTTEIRMVPSDVTRLTTWQTSHNFKLDMLFNGYGSVSRFNDPLTTAFLAVQSQFTWVNHTYSHPYLGCLQVATPAGADPWRCATQADTQPGSAALLGNLFYDEDLIPDSVPVPNDADPSRTMWLSQAAIASQITLNQTWGASRFTHFDTHALVTGEHSGLAALPEQDADSPFLGAALESAGITYTGSDASREPDSRVVDGGTTRTLPRYPMNIFYNAGTYGDEVDEYNWIYTSAADGGSGICTANPETSTCIEPLANANATEAQQSFTDYIVPLEVRNAYSKVTTNDPRPFYAHQSNLAENGILYPVLNGVLAQYRATYDEAKSPLVNEDVVTLGDALNRMTDWGSDASDVSAYIDAAGVHLSGPSGTSVPLTVPSDASATGLSAYDGELSGWLSAPSADTVVAVPNTPMGGYVGHTPPDAPTALVVATNEFLDQVALTWAAPAVDGGSPLTGFIIDQSADGGATWTPVRWPAAGDTSIAIGALLPGVDYRYRIQAINAVGASPYTAPSAAIQRVSAATVSAPDVVYGTPTSVALTVDTAYGFAPTGTATLTINGNTYTESYPSASGNTLTFSVPGLVPGTYPYTVAYGSDAHIQPISKDGSTTVTKAAVTVTGAVGTVPTPLTGGTYAVAVTPPTGLATPTGAIALTLTGPGSTVVVDGTLADGAFTATLPTLAVGTWTASIAYAGDANYDALTTAGSSVVSSKATVTVTGAVGTAPSPQTAGTFSISVVQADGLPVPTGTAAVTLTLMDGANPVAGVDPVTIDATALDAAGSVTLALPQLRAGTWVSLVAYSGDGNYAETSVAGETVVSAKADVTGLVGVVVTAPTPQADGSYKVTATPPSGLAAPAGDVTVTLTNGSLVRTLTGTLSGGTVTMPIAALPAGTWTASVSYAGDANYLAATSAGESAVSTKGDVTVSGTLDVDPTPQETGSYHMTVAPVVGAAAPTGTVTVTLVNGLDTKSAMGTLAAGEVTVTVPKLPVGTWVATFAYSGDDNYLGSSASGGEVVSTTGPVTLGGTVTTAPSPQSLGEYEITVAQPVGLADPEGDVTLTLTHGSDSVTLMGTLSGGAASIELPMLGAGTWLASISYSGDANYAATTGTGESVVSVKAEVTSVVGTVTTQPKTTTEGAYQVTVTPPTGLAPANGQVTVSFTRGSVTKSATGTVAGGTASVVVPRLTVGTWTASIAYAGDANYAAKTAAGSSVASAKGAVASLKTTVTKRPTTTKSGSYQVTVTAPSGMAAPTGKVSVTLKKGTSTKKIYGTLKSGKVTITVPKLPKGVWKASVYYPGDSTYLSKTATGAYVVVGQIKVPKMTTAVVTAPTTKLSGKYSVSVIRYTGYPAISGKVMVTLKKGSTTKKVYGTVHSGVAVVTVPKLSKGTWKVTASYLGSSIYYKKSVTGKSVVVTK
jgi:hypothetical protein